jgi:hypothetical protein
MKKLILASAAAILLSAGTSLAAMPLTSLSDVVTGTTASDNVHLARKGSDDAGGDDRGGTRGNASGDDRGGDSGKGRGRGRGRGGDDRGGDDSASNDISTDDNSVSGSGRRKARVPGGSGCDSAGDVAEHASCSPNQ